MRKHVYQNDLITEIKRRETNKVSLLLCLINSITSSTDVWVTVWVIRHQVTLKVRKREDLCKIAEKFAQIVEIGLMDPNRP